MKHIIILAALICSCIDFCLARYEQCQCMLLYGLLISKFVTGNKPKHIDKEELDKLAVQNEKYMFKHLNEEGRVVEAYKAGFSKALQYLSNKK